LANLENSIEIVENRRQWFR